MYKINQHPILDVPAEIAVEFTFNGQKVKGEKGFTIAAALHQAGFPVHSHSLEDRNRSLECGIGKCGACEMLVDGIVRRICITQVDGYKEVKEIPHNFEPVATSVNPEKEIHVYKTDVVIIGAGPAGLAAREVLNQHKVSNIVIDSRDRRAHV